jgi:NADPH:quinone reductase-like Zn-dependent oxidoreductase
MRVLTGFRPTHPILGVDLAGTIETVGPRVTRFAAGDAQRQGSSGPHEKRARTQVAALLSLNLVLVANVRWRLSFGGHENRSRIRERFLLATAAAVQQDSSFATDNT